MKSETLSFDFCIVGGGLTGLAAALAAARHGAKVALIQDRPVLGGNSSSEIRMHVCGAHRENRRETGILEECLLDNYFYNPTANFSIWDTVLYGKAQYQPNLSLFLNTSVNGVTLWGNHLAAIKAYQMTSETHFTFYAPLFADCSGDGVLAPLTGADFRMGREARSEFNESIAPEVADARTMGMSCLFQAREHSTPQPFKPFPWANSYTGKNLEWLKGRNVNVYGDNFWWMEIGGMVDSIHDTEICREELIRIALGVWDYVKNYAPDKDKFANFSLDWQGFLPGKRESRRYYGDVILNQNDVEAEGRFDDLVAYGGWSMDDHFPQGFYHIGAGTIFHPAPSPFGIPFRSLYSRNIDNLFCAGRCHSATHTALSSTRVMATCALMGQAVGTAAAIAQSKGLSSPRAVYEKAIAELQHKLMDDDCWLPWHVRPIAPLFQSGKITASGGEGAEFIRSGTDRPWEDCPNAWTGNLGDALECQFQAEATLSEVRLVFDSDLNRTDPSRNNHKLNNMRYYQGLHDTPFAPPATLIKAFRIETKASNGTWQLATRCESNFQRLVRLPIQARTSAIRIIPEATWGAPIARIFAFEAQ